MVETIRLIFTGIALLFLFVLVLKKEQDEKRNWAIFYSLLYTAVSLCIVNYACASLGYWSFNEVNSLNMPYDIAFVWIVLWGIVPVFFLDKRYFWICLLLVFWSDYLLMPQLDMYGVLILNHNWLIGEFLSIGLVFIPAYIWAYCSYYSILKGIRAISQVVVMSLIFTVALPFILYVYGLIEQLNTSFDGIQFQLFLIVVFPALVAVVDLVKKGKGTPFPYDETKYLVRTGVYAYCRNPIQWSFTLMFVPMAIYHSSWYLLIGSIVSVAYAIGVSDVQEYPDMEKRFGEGWVMYKKHTPKWYFQWVATSYPQGTIYFDYDCGVCSELANWFQKKTTQQLVIKNASEYKGNQLLQVTYIDYFGNEYKSVQAIASALEHINLAYASIGWFMRFPIVNCILQALVDASGIDNTKECEIK